MKRYSHIKWVGGKRWLARRVDEVLPEGFDDTIDTIVEPFAGSAVMTFTILASHPNVKRVVINDKNKKLINAFRQIRDNTDELISRLKQMESAYYEADASEGLEGRKKYFYKMRDEFNSGFFDAISEAACFLFFNRTCFNGVWRVNSSGAFNTPHGLVRGPICDEPLLRDMAAKMHQTDFVTLHDDYTVTAQYASPGTFYYLDPPYKPLNGDSSFHGYNNDHFGDSDQEALKGFCDIVSQRGAKVLQSNSSATGEDGERYFDKLYAGYSIMTVNVTRTINAKFQKRTHVDELLIANYKNNFFKTYEQND